jgi:hypothetical protein
MPGWAAERTFVRARCGSANAQRAYTGRRLGGARGGTGTYRALVRGSWLMVGVRQHDGHASHAGGCGGQDRGADECLGGDCRTDSFAGCARGQRPGAATGAVPRP